MVLTFCNPVAVPDEESTFLYFCGSQDTHRVPTARFNPNSLVATVPGKSVSSFPFSFVLVMKITPHCTSELVEKLHNNIEVLFVT